MNILSVLEKKFNILEPIFDYEIYELGYTDSDIRDTLKENVFEEININKSFNIDSKAYTIVNYSELFDLYTKVDGNSEQLIFKYYIGNNNEYGYYSYLTLYNKLGLSTQVPNVVYINSTRTDNDINVGNYKITKIDEYTREDLPYIYLSTIFNFEYTIEYSLDNIYNKLKDKVDDINKLLKMTRKERWNKVYEFLHNTNEFVGIINYVSQYLKIKESHIEKDYYVFMLLKLIRHYNNEIMFKGGTSLSKAWGILPRFSEDIDLNLLPEVPSTDSHRQKFARAVYKSLLDMGFNYDYSKIRSRQEYNTFEQPYNAIYKDIYLNENIKIETMANKRGKILNATYTPRLISNYIWDTMGGNQKYTNILVQFGLEPFEINTQNMDVTFVEKVMSLTNRFIKGESFRLSRHLYDIYYMWNYGNLSNFDLSSTMTLTKQHLMERTNDICLRQELPAYNYLMQALISDFYKNDFNNITIGMKFNVNDGVTYEMCRDLLINIINTRVGIFNIKILRIRHERYSRR